MVFNDPQFKDYSRVWVYVSQTFDLKNVGNSIISQLSGKEEQNQGLQIIHNRLEKLFADKKILIILDDLWENDSGNLEKLKSMLKQGEGSKVIVMVTTRDENIARQICTVELEPYKLDPLTKEMCWDIIKQKSDFESRPDKDQLKPVGEQIANKCGGVALAAHSLGHMLKFKLYEKWLWMRDNDIWNLPTSEDTSTHRVVLTSLLLSYNCMSPYLRLCFGYCGIFPKGCHISKDDLIHQWIALGLIGPSKQLGEDYVRRLVAMSFLQHPKIFDAEDVGVLTMHDLVHDLARAVMADEVDIYSSRCRYAYVTDSTEPLKSSKIRALHFVGHSDQLHGYASAAKYLRVLHLRACGIEELPNCIGQLKLLRYLNAPHREGQIIPKYITKLSKLCYLNLGMKGLVYRRERDIKQNMPGSFVELRELVHLDLAYRGDVLGIPEALGGLTKLQHLDLSGCSGLRGLPEVISNLSELRCLHLRNCMGSIFGSSSTDQTQSFIDCIFTLPYMEHLDLSFNYGYRFSIPEGASKLRNLDLMGCNSIVEIPESVVKMDRQRLFGLLPNFSVRADDGASSSNLIWLQHVNPDELRIMCLENVKSPEEAHKISLSGKQRIGALRLEWTNGAVRFVEDMELLTELVPSTTLKDFTIQGYNNASFPDWLMGANIRTYLPNLVRVEMRNLPNCKIIPPALSQLKNLQELVLSEMQSVEEWSTTQHCGEDGVNELFPKLEKLSIIDCPKLRIKSHPPRANSWNIFLSDDVVTSWPESASHTGGSSSSSAVPVIGGGANSRLHLVLAQLERYVLVLFWFLQEVFTWIFRPRSRAMAIAPSALSPPLSLTSLRVTSEVALRDWRLLCHLPPLGDLTISCCSDVTISPEITRALSSLKSLTLDRLGLTEPLEWLGELTSLQQLSIRQCDELKGLHENMRQLTQLQPLELFFCDSMTSLPQWLGELASLENLKIYHCPAIRSLPDSIQQLTNLQTLSIMLCWDLGEWCKSEENMLKLAHIKCKRPDFVFSRNAIDQEHDAEDSE